MSDYAQDALFITDLLEKISADDQDLMIIEDTENTKKITFKNFKASLISDNETPATHRLYSSYKISQLIGDAKTIFEDTVGGYNESIQQLQKDKVSQNDLKTELKKLADSKLDNEFRDEVLKELDVTRKITDKISSKDLACGTEEEKIHIEHLGSDIIDAITGKTQVTIPSVPTGGWRGEDIANDSISSLKLKRDFMFRGVYSEGDLNRLVETGLYEVAATVEGVPHIEGDMNETRLVQVYRYGSDAQYIIQRVFYKQFSNTARPWFERKGQFSRLSTLQFLAHYEINEQNKVTQEMLGDQYNNRGILEEGNLFEVNIAGNYLCDSKVVGLPTADKYLVNIRYFDDRKEYEAKRADVNGCVTYCCYEYYDSNHGIHRTDWFNITNILKSKFDGKDLHIFGDGISYGLGATNPASTAYPALLHSKYGYVIHNHSLMDATAGNYDDENLKKCSILTQIDRATGLGSNNDDFYALIFVGGEDYRNSLSAIGTDQYENEVTFKGALNLAIKKLMEKAPNCKIMLVTPLYRASTEPGDGLDCDSNLVNGKYLSEFADAMIAIGNKNHIPVLDLFRECMINKYNSNICLDQDGVYPLDKTHALIAEKIHDGMCKFY